MKREAAASGNQSNRVKVPNKEVATPKGGSDEGSDFEALCNDFLVCGALASLAVDS